ncbi:MAG: TolC family protein [Muribaculaceae bacterium]|jgi:NodT family efflux transporter outer membrane factor (OMF) lipoprotein|nr:TolC family protein [Muribaculaceae bacterium]
MKFDKIARIGLLTAVGVTMLSSCHIYKKFDMPQDTAMTKEYVQAKESAPDSTAYGNLNWQSVFTDPLLQDYINRALTNNVNLENARLNVDVARANLLGAKLSYLPAVAINATGAGASYAGSGFSGSWNYTIPMAISWEIDVFGKILNNKRSASAAVRMQEDYLQAAHSQIITGVATCYYTIATLNAQLALSKETAEIWAKNVEIMKDYKEAGRVNQAAVVQSQAQYWSILASITDLETALTQANNSMSLLLNEAPATWEIPATARMEVPQILRDGVAMRELAMRPDVRAAEEGLATAYYATNSARAAFYPGITITSNGGFTNLLGSFIKNPGDWFIQLAGSLTAPLFSRGQNIARLKGAKAQQQQAMNNFEHTLLSAAAEVNNYCVALDKTASKTAYLTEQVKNLEEAVEATNLLLAYDGKTTYLEVLTAQSSLLNAQISLLSTELAREQALINLYQSLGGGR